MTTLEQMGAKAKDASRFLMTAGSKKDIALGAIADALCENCEEILAANKIDLENGEKSGLTASLLDRLRLSEERINGMADGVRQVAALPDPVGRVLDGRTLKNGLQIEKVTVPMGVIGIIFEARPNVTSDAAALCLKAGSAVILRGGKEAFHSNMAIAKVMRDALEKAGFPRDCVALVEDTTRQSATELMQLSDYLDVLIPRGGAGLIKSVVENAKVLLSKQAWVTAISMLTRVQILKWRRILFSTAKPLAHLCAMRLKHCLYTRISQKKLCL